MNAPRIACQPPVAHPGDLECQPGSLVAVMPCPPLFDAEIRRTALDRFYRYLASGTTKCVTTFPRSLAACTAELTDSHAVLATAFATHLMTSMAFSFAMCPT